MRPCHWRPRSRDCSACSTRSRRHRWVVRPGARSRRLSPAGAVSVCWAAELAATPGALSDYQADVDRGDLPALPVWAGEAVDLVTDLPPAADLVAALAAQAGDALARAGQHQPGD